MFMSRSPRIVIPGQPHHVTQRGSHRQDVFFCDEDRALYLELLTYYVKKYGAELLAYCLMNNHVHHLLVPWHEEDLAKIFKPLHSQYAAIINQREGWTGHLWQERFYSSPVDEIYVRHVARYVEQNSWKAGLVTHPTEYAWSSAAVRCGLRVEATVTLKGGWAEILGMGEEWFSYLSESECETRVKLMECVFFRDLPFGSEEFISKLERITGRCLRPRPRGRPSFKNR